MYNPSKKVTKLLEEYLEFDAEQLKLGIWSGDLSVNDVNLKADSIYPHLNRIFAAGDSPKTEFTKVRPPLRMKLVSGTIGELSMSIPWKSLVWGQGDVKVNLRNVVLVLAMESLEETQNRAASSAAPTEDHSENSTAGTGEEKHHGSGESSQEDQATKARKRYQKQKILREAEKRQLLGRDITNWLERVYKKEEEERLREAVRAQASLVKQEGRVRSWLKGATNDFFWRLFAGLQAKIENLKIVIIQDSIEVGLIIPSIHMLAGKQDGQTGADEDHRRVPDTGSSSSKLESPPLNLVYESPDDDGEHVEKHLRILGLGIYVRRLSKQARPPILTRAGVDRFSSIRTLQEPDQPPWQLSDVSTKDYILRPTEVNVLQSLFFPYPPDKRKKKKQNLQNPTLASDTDTVTISSQSTASSKRRRGKRDKTLSNNKNNSPKTPPTEPPSPSTDGKSSNSQRRHSAAPGVDVDSTAVAAKPKKTMVMRRMSISQVQGRKPLPSQPAETTPTKTAQGANAPSNDENPAPAAQQVSVAPTRLKLSRRSSMAGPIQGSTASTEIVSRVPQQEAQKGTKKNVPLARSDDSSVFSTLSKDNTKELTAKFEGDVRVGPMEVILSSKHYNMMANFLSACTRMRNGRPSQTITSVLEVKPVRHSVLIKSADLARATSGGSESIRLGLNAPLNERSLVVRSWWRYGLFAVRWEIQQRRKVRKHFQDKYLTFNWEQQRHRRKEYIDLYIASNLSSVPMETKSLSRSEVEEVLASIEDELPIEQVLLYRAIARILHVAGETTMPPSLTDVRTAAESHGILDSRKSTFPSRGSLERSSSRESNISEVHFERAATNNKSVLNLLDEACEISRLRMEDSHAEVLPRHKPLAGTTPVDIKSHGMEESTIGMTLDTRHVGRGGSNFSRAPVRRGGNRPAPTDDVPPETSMKFFFKGSLEKVELMIVEEEMQFEGYGVRPKDVDADNSSNETSLSVGEVSELTDDDIFSDSGTQVTGIDDESGSDPILASTDFLLFRQPEKVLLRAEVRNIVSSAFLQSAGTKNFNFTIGRIQALVTNGRKLLEVGTEIDAFGSAINSRIPLGLDDSGVESRNALTLSLSLQKDKQVIQCDVAPFKAVCDLDAISSLMLFSSSSKSPRRLIPPTPGENVRMYVINQNVGTAFRFFDASFRLHGVEITLPCQSLDKRKEEELPSEDEGERSSTRAIFVADLVEIYSGKAAQDLAPPKTNWQDALAATRLTVLGEEDMRDSASKARHLQMLDIDELLSRKSTVFSFNVVGAVSGLDFVVCENENDGMEETKLSFLDSPVDVELFGSVNESSVLDYNRAQRDVVVKVSSVHAIVSETRLKLLSDVFPRKGLQFQNSVNFGEPEPIPPRLEILARLILNFFQINIARVRISLVTDEKGKVGHGMLSKFDEMEDFLMGFLKTVSKLDLSWPYEEALSSAMQICIDRLTGIGFHLEVAWECSNTALLNFLEDLASIDETGMGVSEAVDSACARTVSAFSHRLEDAVSTTQLVENHLVLDFPDGLSATIVDLFYDHFVAITLNSVFVTNGQGIHLLRLMPEVSQASETDKQDLDARSDAVASYTTDKSPSSETNHALLFRWFKVNEKYSFGRGGLPLSVLGGEIHEVTEVQDEYLIDVDIGELEILFSEDVFDDVLYEVCRIFDPLEDLLRSSASPTSPRVEAQTSYLVRTLVCTSCFSVLFTNVELVPFTRVILGHCVTFSESKTGTTSASTKTSAKQLSLLYLAPYGELYPEQVCVHDMTPGHPLTVILDTTSGGASLCRVELLGIRLYLLKQFITECLQYFHSGTVGLSLWMVKSSEALSKFRTPSKSKKSMVVEIYFLDTSVIVPKSSGSSEMVAFEVDRAKISFDKPAESFDMPSKEHPIRLSPSSSVENQEGKVNNGVGSGVNASKPVNRTVIDLLKFHVFVSLGEPGQQVASDGARESLAFNCFFEVDGRALEGKKVYRQIAPPQNYEIETEKAERCWREITTTTASLKVIVDYAPHLRILICDKVEGIRNPLSLDVTLSQFSLLLSCWYDNMQELPVMFPYSGDEVKVGATSITKGGKFAEFGTEEYRKVMESSHRSLSEFVMSLSRISLRCMTDRSFETVQNEAKGIVLGLDDCTLHVISDAMGVTKVGLGALGACFVDEEKVHQRVIEVKNAKQALHSWADMTFGTEESCNHLIDELPLPFQMSVFLAPKAVLYNLGMDSSLLTLADFNSIFGFLGFVTVYFVEKDLGYPYLRAAEFLSETKKRILGVSDEVEQPPSEYLTNFRLWLTRPALWVPINPAVSSTPFLILESDKGLWFRCATIDLFLSLECILKGFGLSYIDRDDVKNPGLGKSLLEGLSLGLRIDIDGDNNHTDYALKIPYNDEWGCSLTSKRISVDPIIVPRPTICQPVQTLDRFLGPTICEMTCVVDVLPVTFAALSNLFVGAPDSDDSRANRSLSPDADKDGLSNGLGEEDSNVGEGSEGDPVATFSFSGDLGDIRLFTLDPVLGPHLPVAVVSISSFKLTASKFSGVPDEEPRRGESPPEDLQFYVDGHVWADSFKLGLTRSWEPLVEAYSFRLFYEESRYRGSGVTFKSDVPFHINITGANLLVLDEVAESMVRQVKETFGEATSPRRKEGTSIVTRASVQTTEDFQGFSVAHRLPKALTHGDRVAFSLKNMTGQCLRTYRSETSGRKAATISYVEQEKAIRVLFNPSVSMVVNSQVVEVGYPGYEGSPRLLNSFARLEAEQHELTIQIPGFQWMRGVKIDNFGRHFVDLTPRSSLLRERAREDWRIRNVLKLLVEVGLENGGRALTARSMFSIVNKTTHALSLFIHTNSSFTPGSTDDEGVFLESGCAHQIPVLLLESALRQGGSMELGCLWLRPYKGALPRTVCEEGKDGIKAQFSSRPIQLGRIVTDSALMFEGSKGEDIAPEQADTAVQISCPVQGGSVEREWAPFCYAVEVGRSPVVRAREIESPKTEPGHTFVHGPIAYTLSVFAPFVVANLLPEAGRFELMHAVRRTVLWFADLEPGQQISVHSVGLDAPLLLLINLRFCRTPIGEGALVHHGVDPPTDPRVNLSRLRSFGKAGKAVTIQVGKALTSLGDTPDKRGQQLLFGAQDRVNRPIGVREQKHVRKGADFSGIQDGDGKTYRVDTTVFFPEDCAEETTVVDGVGQRLTLGIENIRGGGGQRRVSVYCPFWIINTTEHALLYRQHNSKLCVSGSVVSPQMDGSQTLSGGHVAMKSETVAPNGTNENSVKPINGGTIYGGTPGALATSPGYCNLPPEHLAPLLEENLPHEVLSRLAFMFNFHEGLTSGGSQKLCVQLHDGTSGTDRYYSDWSRGFSLNSVGISQIVEMNCKDGRSLELSMVPQTAPGYLSKFTKIVRFLPRYVIVNNLPFPVRIWQDSSIFQPATGADIVDDSTNRKSRRWRITSKRSKKDKGKINQYEALWGREVDIMAEEVGFTFPDGTTAPISASFVKSVPPSSWKPFNLPDSCGDRQLRIGIGGPHNISASISADVPGEHTLRLTRAVDLRLLKHVSTRASPQYTITLPPRRGDFSGELGLWFETEWGTDRSLIVKAIRYDSYCYNKTDVHVGDELLLIDGAPVARMTFSEAMNMLRNRIGEIRSTTGASEGRRGSIRRASLSFAFSSRNAPVASPEPNPTLSNRTLTLTFRTVEERLRRVRLKAARNNVNGTGRNENATNSDFGSTPEGGEIQDFVFIKSELKTLHKSMYLVLGSVGAVPYEVQNRTQSSTVYFRQRGCYSHPWRMLKPGASDVYCWEEPMKGKRLTLRVATEDSFVFASGRDQRDTLRPMMDASEIGRSTHMQGIFSAKVKDEEEAVFSKSVSVRLEEIGFKDFLQYEPGGSNHTKHLELEVDVVGSTRVLVVRDISAESDSEEQLMSNLSSLKLKCLEEEQRANELRELRAQLPAVPNAEEMKQEDVDAASVCTDSARNLMQDFPEEKRITGVHQMVVEVLEATGLSPDNYVGVCNPYVEVSLRSASDIGRNLIQRFTKQCRRTYFIRRSVNPQWNSQSFIFNVPSLAAVITRGHAVKVKVRNFRRVGRHANLGMAHIDLLSVKNNNPLLGWFPLAGRVGRRELENSLSHWGRGSIKLKIHWVYTVHALLDYFLLLSEARLADLKDSVQGMTGQLEKRREEKRKKQERIDGFKAVRIKNLSSSAQSSPSITKSLLVSKGEADLGNAFRRLSDHRRMSVVSNATQSIVDLPSSKRNTITPRHTPSMRHDVEDQISLRRQLLFKAIPNLRSSVMTVDGTASIGAFRSWEEAKVFFNDESIDISCNGQEFTLRFLGTPARQKDLTEESSEKRQLMGKLKVPSNSPALMKAAATEYAARFAASRASMEKFSRSSLRACLNPGGWLTIRPIQALNLPDSYNGMSVKVRYGSETLSSEVVDSVVYPRWFRPSNDLNGAAISPESLEYFPGDLHIFVAPQRTSGSIRVSVVGEGQGQRMNVKTELGVLYIPLGLAITACIDCIEEYFDSEMNEEASSPVYMRWFPLIDPKATTPVEGDRRTSSRPREAEKDGDAMFTDYFSPCIQLALIWSPESEPSGAEMDEAENMEMEDGGIGSDSKVALTRENSKRILDAGGSTESRRSDQAKMVENYWNANIGQVSFALIDSQRARELISGCICDVDVQYWVTKAKTRFGFAVGWFQIDQQDDYAREPVILAPTPAEYVSTVFQVLALKDNLRSKNDVLTFEFIDFSLAEFDLMLEETLLLDIADFLSSLRLRKALTNNSRRNEGLVEDLSTLGDSKSLFLIGDKLDVNPESSLLSLVSEGVDETKGQHRTYIEQLVLGVVKFNLSYSKGTKENRSVIEEKLVGRMAVHASDAGGRIFGMWLPTSQHENSDVFLKWSQDTAQDYRGAAFTLPSFFTSLLPTVSDAPFRLQGKALDHVFDRPGEIIQSIRKFYANETLKQLYKIIGAFDFVGNPTMLVNSFLSGLRDLVIIPLQAFMKSRNASSVAVGFGQGTLSLISHSASGFFGFTSKLFATFGQVCSELSLDKDFRTWHRDNVLAEAGNLNRAWKKRGVQSASQMIVRPITDIAFGIGTGLVGVISSPIKGYRRSGNIGLVQGTVAGVVGVFMKPIVGVLDAISHFTASIHDIAKSVNVLEKRFQPAIKYRLPYVFGISNILTSFDDSYSRAFYLLRLFPIKTGRRQLDSMAETLVHVEVLNNIGTDTYAIVTNARLILIRFRQRAQGLPTLCWQVSISGSASVSSQVAEHGHNGFALTITLKKRPVLENGSVVERQFESEPVALSTDSVDGDDENVDQSQMDGPFESGAEDFDHGTSRGEGGELLEWFTVVAEYQYRRQLAKLHNAISCVAGNLDDVIHDPSLGRPGSTQFYTSFGIYHFEQIRPDVSVARNPLENIMEDLPWVLGNEYSPGEPLWLVLARQRAANAFEVSIRTEHPNDDATNRTNSQAAEKGPVRKIARWIQARLPTIVDSEEEGFVKDVSAGDIEHGTRQRRRDDQVPGNLTAASNPALRENRGSRHSTDSNFTDSYFTSGEEMSSEIGATNQVSSALEARDSTADEMSYQTTHYDSGTAFQDGQSGARPESRDSPANEMSFVTARRSLTHSLESRTYKYSEPAVYADQAIFTPPRETPRYLEKEELAEGRTRTFEDDEDRGIDLALNQSPDEEGKQPKKASPRLLGMPELVDDRTEMLGEEGTKEVRTPQSPVDPEDRLGRMEKIMEQLLLFSSEQALQNATAKITRPSRVTSDPIQEEIRILRKALKNQNDESHDEIYKLRQEVIKLAHIVAGGSRMSESSSYRRGEDDGSDVEASVDL